MADQNPTRPVSSFFNNLFSPKYSESSPTSILDNPFQPTTNRVNPVKNPPEKLDPEGIALALIEQRPDETDLKLNTISRKILFASNLKIQIPEFCGDYGIKTRSPHFSAGSGTGFGSPRSFTGPLSLKEMELSEEYTRVVSHGPNPKTTHIYDNCVIGLPELKKPGPKPVCESFLSFCHTCNKNLEEGNDILIYGGDKAFCSEECRCQEMILDGLMMN
ncbi:FCS-Like Zinc finger 8-like [Bidens hawaiensis]|uniref:FCS-Like Zinc finger 8-like n=1 Tax=Bidens hawaiensis TaxID=980011 RepID=UPI00404A8EF6